MNKLIAVLALSMTGLSVMQVHANPTVDKLLEKYQQQGASQIMPEKGRQLWFAKTGERSCTSCHGSSPDKMGKHVKTGKIIKPMAGSVNSERFQSVKKVEKWFLRNCKWTLGRKCTVQEKANTLSWLNSF